MGALHIAVGGGVAFFTLFAVSRAVDGAIGAVAALLAMVVGTLTIGFVVAAGVASWQRRRTAARYCSTCYRPMTEIGEYRVCSSCDQIVVGS